MMPLYIELRDDLRGRLNDEEFVSAQKRGESLNLDAIVEEILTSEWDD